MVKKCSDYKLGDTRFPDIWLHVGKTKYYVEVKAKQFSSKTTSASDIGQFIDFNVDVTGSRDISINAFHFFLLVKYYPAGEIYDGTRYDFNTPFLWSLQSMNELAGTLTICDVVKETEIIKKNLDYETFLKYIQPKSAGSKKEKAAKEMEEIDIASFRKKHEIFVEKFEKAMNIVFATASVKKDTSKGPRFGQLVEDWVREACKKEKLLDSCIKYNYHITASEFNKVSSSAPEVAAGPWEKDVPEIEANQRKQEQEQLESSRSTGNTTT